MKNTLIIILIMSVITILITGNWDIVSNLVFPNTTWGLYNRDFFENFLVEVHGGILDLIIIGIIIYCLDKRKNVRELKIKAKEKMKSLQFYIGDDSSYLSYNALRNLLSFGDNKVDIPEVNLSKLKIDKLDLINSNLIAVDFSESTLSNTIIKESNLQACKFIDTKFNKVVLVNVDLQRSKFINSKLNGMDFSKTKIMGVDFRNSDLKSANFKGVDCSKVNFKGANLRSANFMNATNISIDQIKEAKDYSYIKGIQDI